MNISDSIKKTGIGVDKPTLEKASANKAESTASTKENTVATDNVTLSATSVQLQSDIRSSEVFDAQKVERIKEAIARGEFSIDSGKVADGLLQSVKDMLQPKLG